MAVALYFVYRSFYNMRIEVGGLGQKMKQPIQMLLPSQ